MTDEKLMEMLREALSLEPADHEVMTRFYQQLEQLALTGSELAMRLTNDQGEAIAEVIPSLTRLLMAAADIVEVHQRTGLFNSFASAEEGKEFDA